MKGAHRYRYHQNTAGGGSQCNSIAVTAFGTLLAAAGACDQQNNADIMMDLSKKLNSQDMIKFAQIFCQQPRNTVRMIVLSRGGLIFTRNPSPIPSVSSTVSKRRAMQSSMDSSNASSKAQILTTSPTARRSAARARYHLDRQLP